MKTFKGWIGNGFVVKTGEKSTADGLTWVSVKGKEDSPEEPGYMMAKVYKLFHRSQVKEL